MIIHKCDVCGAELKAKEGTSKFSYKTYLDYDLDLDDMPMTRFQTYEFCQECAFKIREKIERKEI